MEDAEVYGEEQGDAAQRFSRKVPAGHRGCDFQKEILMSIPQWKKDRCDLCAEGRKSMPHGSARMHYFTFGSVKPFAPAKPSVLCTAPTEAEYIAELEAKLDFAHGRYQDLGQVSCDGFTAIAKALSLPASATTEQCVERAEELRKDGERLDWLEQNPESGEPYIVYHPPSGDITWKVSSEVEFHDLRAALDAARGEKP